MLLSPHVLHAFKWSMLAEAASRLIAPLSFFLLALVLAPEDFGVVAAATVAISLSLAIAEAGLGKALVQYDGEVEPAASTAYWITVSFGLFATILLWLSAPYIALFFQNTKVANVIRLLSLQCVLASLCTVPAALLQRRLAFRDLFWVRLSTTALPNLASIPLALAGMGYWALVAGTLAGQAAQVIVLWRIGHWVPRFQLAPKVAGSLLRFGRWAALSTLLAWFYTWVDTLIVGHYLGSHEMGLYRVGNALVVAAFGLVLTPLLPVLFPLFSRHQHNLPEIRSDLAQVVRTIASISLPGGALLLLGSPLADAVLASKGWSGIGTVIAFLGAAHCIAWVVGANGEALRGAGKPHAETLAMGLAIFGYLAAFLFAIHYGLQTFLAARLGMACVGVLVQISVARWAIRFPVLSTLHAIRRPLLFAAAIAALYFVPARHDDVAIDLLVLSVGLLLYCAFLWTSERKLLRAALRTMCVLDPAAQTDRP
jgi:PST family polysaccharide transporter